MFCNKCGTKLDNEAKFCIACGNKIISAPSNNENTISTAYVPKETDTINRSTTSDPTESAPIIYSTAPAESVPTKNTLNPKKIIMGVAWRMLVIAAAIILLGGTSAYFDLYESNKEISIAIIGDYDNNGIASVLFAGTPYIVCFCALFMILGALSRNAMSYIIPFLTYWVIPFVHEEINTMALENMSDSIGAVCLYRASVYGVLTDDIESLCRKALIMLIPALILNIIYNIVFPKKSIIQIIAESRKATAPTPSNTPSLRSVQPDDNETESKYWTCRKCGSRNSLYSENCKDCGAYK